ncbi:MAG TPA: hypothetical protein PKW37_04330 [Salinivirgaceae bacterium]|nr:hypothetical protein [Salinivirgaceae bacterium]
MRKPNNYKTLLILIAIVIIGYWQVSFLVYSLKWDLIDVVLPFRYYFSECLNSGYFPLWNPYQQTGFPFYADLQAPTYYPELLLTSLFGRYGVYTMHLLFVGYLIIAAIGMYKLSYHFNQSRNASIMASLSYVFCGFFIGHGQHFFLFVGAAWIPFVILSYIKMNQYRKVINCIKTAVFVFLLVTGAYQALSIAMLYLLILIFIYFFFKEIVKKNWKKALQIVKSNLYFSLLIIILLLPLIVSTFEILNSVERFSSGVDMEKTLAFGQPITTFLSFIVPFSTLKYSDFFGNINGSLINHYFGIIPLLFFIISLFKRHSVLEYIIFGFGIIIFSMSFSFLPVGKLMFQHVPLMNLFLSAAYIRIYGLLAFILLAAKYFSIFEQKISLEKNKIITAGSLMSVILIGLIIISVNKVTYHDFQALFNSDYISEVYKKMSFYQHTLLQAIFQLFIVSCFIVTIIFYKKIKRPITIILILITTELFFAAQLNMHTVIDTQRKPRNMHKCLKLSPKGFPVPINSKVIYNDQQHAFFVPFWRNTYIFTKQVSFDAFSSFELDSYSKLKDKYPNVRTAVLNNHLFYFSDTILPITQFYDKDISVKSSKQLFLSPEDYDVLRDIKVKSDNTDQIKIKEFSPNKVVVETQTKHDNYLTLLQTNYKGWKAYIDDNETPIYTSNFNYRTILLPEGNHIVKYEYKNNKIVVFYVISNILFFSCILFLLGYWLFTKHKQGKNYIYIPSAIFLLLLFLIIFRFSKKQTDSTIHEYYDTKYPQEKAYFHEIRNNINIPDSSNRASVISQFVADSTIEFIPITETTQINKKIKEGTLKVSFKLLPENYNSILIVSEIAGEWHANKLERQIEKLNQWNDVIYLRPIPDMKDGEILKVYLWNNNKTTFTIDSVHIELHD